MVQYNIEESKFDDPKHIAHVKFIEISVHQHNNCHNTLLQITQDYSIKIYATN